MPRINLPEFSRLINTCNGLVLSHSNKRIHNSADYIFFIDKGNINLTLRKMIRSYGKVPIPSDLYLKLLVMPKTLVATYRFNSMCSSSVDLIIVTDVGFDTQVQHSFVVGSTLVQIPANFKEEH